MKLGIIVVGERNAGKTTSLAKVKEKIDISTSQWTFDCCGRRRGFIIAGSWDELEHKTPDGVDERLRQVCDDYQVVVIPAWHENVPGSYLPIYLNVFRDKQFKTVRVDVINMEEDEEAWSIAQEHLAAYVHTLVRSACPDLQR